MRSVVIFAEDYLPNIGGIAVHVHNLAVGLRKAGIHVVVLTTRKIKGRNFFYWKKKKKTIDGVSVIEIPLIYSPKSILKNLQLKYRFAKAVTNEIKRHKSTVFHWHNIYFDPEVTKFIKEDGVRKIFTNHSSQFLLAQRDSAAFKYNSWILTMADHVIVPSLELKTATILSGIEQCKVTYIPNGVDTTIFCPDKNIRRHYRTLLNIYEGDVAIFCPRRIVPKCGVVYLAKALKFIKSNRNIKVFFTGLNGGSLTWRDETYEREVLENLNGLSDNIHVIPLEHIPNSEMPNYYRAMDICVLPSLIEATSISGLEAMASGLSMLATEVGGLPEIIQHQQTGLLVKQADERDLAAKLTDLINDDELRSILADKALATVKEKFDWSIITKKTLSVYFDTM